MANTKAKQEILNQVKALLDASDCVVRVQREMSPRINHTDHRADADTDTFIVGNRVTIIVVGSPK